ncbi:hypothetical protein SAMN05216436_1436 [bacterium A37T11]|nr:hypothetical protein SAMN05216436_1436 [bacterium A37T11]
MNSIQKLALGILIGAWAIGVSAFKTNDRNASKNTTQATYYWFATNNDGTSVGATAKSDSPTSADPDGCTVGPVYCGLGYQESKTTVNASGHRILATGIGATNRDVISQRN